jgi:hypothetical protein
MFRRRRKTSDFGAEIEAHLQLEKERLREQGLRRATPPRRTRSLSRRSLSGPRSREAS